MLRQNRMTRRSALRLSAAASALPLVHIRTAGAAGKVSIGFWDHWVPGGNDVMREYLRNNTSPLTIHAMCEDYRASASIDLELDAADSKAGKKIQCPLLTLWAGKGAMGKLYDVLAIWKEEGVNVSGKPMPGNHSLQESAPMETLAEIQQFLRA